MTSSPSFLGSEFTPSAPEEARFHIVPVPLERTVSYGSGAASGPNAILQASLQLEAFDGVSYPGQSGMFTAPHVDCSGDMRTILRRIEAAAREVFEQDRIPVLLGGEHSLTQAAVQACRESGRDFGVVQIDAHADLRDVYDETPYSHACVMRRIAELGIPIFQIGVRSLCREEIEYRAEHGIPFLDASDLQRSGFPDPLLPEDFPKEVYLTFDVDGLDASLMPATGTPEPGGLSWWHALNAVERVVQHGRRLIGLDVVELAPIPGLHSADYLAAKLTYVLMGFASR